MFNPVEFRTILDNQVRDYIQKALETHAKTIVEQACNEVLNSLKTHSHMDQLSDRLNFVVEVSINGKETSNEK